MWSLKRILVLSLVYSAFNLVALLFWNTPVFGAERARTSPPAANQTAAGGGNPTGRAVAGLNNGAEQLPPGMVYAPRDVVDMTRLVLETNRDQTTHLAHYIEHATTIIIVFFSVLGAAGTVFGIKKVDDIERRAGNLTAKFEEAVQLSTGKVSALEADFAGKIAAAEKQIQDKVSLTEANLHLEINDHMELVSARLEIEQALTRKQPVEEANRQLANAVKRIERALREDRVATQAKVRSFADLAYAKKRLQDHAGAFDAVTTALALAAEVGENDSARLALLNYNASCYACILGKAAETLTHLSQAIALDGHWKRKAATDDDFESIRDDQGFKELLGG